MNNYINNNKNIKCHCNIYTPAKLEPLISISINLLYYEVKSKRFDLIVLLVETEKMKYSSYQTYSIFFALTSRYNTAEDPHSLTHPEWIKSKEFV